MNPHRHRHVFRNVLKRAKQSRNAFPFENPVDLQTFPTYIDVVSTPIDLSTMSSRVENGTYDYSISKFLHDVSLIRENCEAFCKDKYPDLIPMAQELEREIQRFLNQAKQDENLEDVEAYMNKTHAVSSSRFLIAETRRKKVVLEEEDEEEEEDGKDVFNIVVRLHNSSKDFVIDYDRYRTGYEKKFVKESAFHTYVGGMDGAKIVKYQRGKFKDGTMQGSNDVLSNGTLPWKAVKVQWVQQQQQSNVGRNNKKNGENGKLDAVNHWDIIDGKHYKKWGR